jgi:LacI family transcriptional regulator/LacI family repressor for deo operon, udp, cdd, tsx, nupC, and nupG
VEPVPPTERRRPPNIRDVAQHAGVGVATVSRVLNGSPLVSVATHRRVRDAIEELGYRRNISARKLSLGRAQAVGVVAPFFTSASVVERLRGVASRLADRGYDLVLFDVENLQQRADAFAGFVRPDRVDGALVISLPLRDAEVAALRRDALPVVLLDTVHPELPHIAIDDVLGGRLAAAHLLAKGHRHVGFVGDEPLNPFGFTSSEDRRAGFRDALGDVRLTEAVGAHGRPGARVAARELLVGQDPPTAVFAASDVQAIGVLEAAGDLGLRVPDDLAVVGFDDIELASVLGLTTVRQPLFATGAVAADLLLALLEDGAPARVALEPLEVIERRTT